MSPEEMFKLWRQSTIIGPTVMQHTNGNQYVLLSHCEVQIEGEWKTAYVYQPAGEGKLYCRLETDFEKFTYLGNLKPE